MPSIPSTCSRRDALALSGGALVGLAGCTGRDPGATATPDPTDTDADPAPSGEPTTAEPTSPTPEPRTDIAVEGGSIAWERALGGGKGSGNGDGGGNGDGSASGLVAGPAFLDGTVAVVVGTTVYALDAATGETAWTFDTAVSLDGEYGYGRPAGDLRVHDGTLYALVGISVGTGAHDHVLHALTADGDERWSFGTGVAGFHSFVGFGGGAVVVATGDDAIGDRPSHAVVAVDTATGSRRWTAESGDARGGSVGDGVAVVETYRAVDCFDLASGERRFRFEPAGDDADVSATAVGGGRVFVANRRYDPGPKDRTMVALSADDGGVDWSLAGSPVTSLRYRGDLYRGGAAVERFAADGTRAWSYDGGGLLYGVPFDRDGLYTNAGSRVVSLARDSGEVRWATEATELALPRARGGDFVVSSDGRTRTVFSHAVDDGEELWRAALPGDYPPVPTAGPGRAYLATSGGSVVAVADEG